MPGGCRQRPHRLNRSAFRIRDHHGLHWPWLIKCLMHETVQEEGHDEHPSGNEPQEVLPSQQVQEENQSPHIRTLQTDPLMQRRPKPNTAAEQQRTGY